MSSNVLSTHDKRPRKKPVRTTQCSCSRTFSNKALLDEHKLIHSSGKPYACLFCDYRSALKDIMRNHIKILHGVLMKKSDIVTQDMLEIMMQRCTICNIEFTDRESLHEHHLKKQSCKPFRCQYCDKLLLKLAQGNSISDTNNLQIKTVQNTLLQNPIQVNNEENIENHQISHDAIMFDIKEENCIDELEACDFEEISYDILDEEAEIIIQATQISNAVNPLDDVINEFVYEIDEHKEEVCSIENTAEMAKRKSDHIYKCKICKQQFCNKATLHKHALTHNTAKPFSCPHCDYRCTLRGILKNHVEIRHGISLKINDIAKEKKDKLYTKAFLCKSCNKIFSSKEGLHDHRMDNNECKPFQCFYCQYRCLLKTTMKRHIKGRHGKDVTCKEIHPIKTNPVKKIQSVARIDGKYNINYYEDQNEMKFEVGVTEIFPEATIKQEITNDDKFSEFEPKYDINSGTIFPENQVTKNFESDMNSIIECEIALASIKEEMTEEDIETSLMYNE